MSNRNIIIGITGTLGAGKGTIVEYLKEKKGFKHYSARKFIIKEIKKRGLTVNRDSMVKVANDLRAKFGSSYVITSLYEQAQQEGGSCIIESIRVPGEVEALRGKGEFYMLAVDADVKKRYARIYSRGSSTDKVSFKEFAANEAREMKADDPIKQNLGKCIEMSNFKFDNSKTREDLYRQVDKVLDKIY